MISQELKEKLDTLDAVVDKIPTFDFNSKLDDAFTLIYHSVNLIEHHKEPLTMDFMHGMKELIYNRKYFGGDTPEESLQPIRVQAMNVVTDKYQEKLKNYQFTLLNQALVMLCSIFEIFLNVCLNLVLKRQPKILLKTAGEKILSLKDILSIQNYQSIVERFREKEVNTFSKDKSIKEKFIYFEKYLGIEINEVFSWETYEEPIQQEYKGWDLDKLQSIFKMRHDIVHRNESPIKRLEDVRQIKDYFQRIILNLSPPLSEKHSIIIDVQYTIYYAAIVQGKMSVEEFCEMYDLRLY